MKSADISSTMFSIVGLGTLHNGKQISIFNLFILGIMSIASTATMYDIYHARKLIQISEVVVVVSAALDGAGKYLFFLTNRYLVDALTTSLNKHLAEVTGYRTNYYEGTIRAIRKTFRVYSAMTAISTLGVITPREWMAAGRRLLFGGPDSYTMREYPLRITWFHDSMEYPYYPYIFAVLATSVFILALSHAIGDIFYFENCLMLRASLKDLQDLVTRTNDVKTEDVNEHLKLIVKRHTRVNGQMEMFRAIISGPIFLIYLTMGSIAAANVFQVESALRSTNAEERGSLVRSITIPTTVLFSLFIYCYMADEISYQSGLVGDVTYQTEWYNLPVKQKKYLILVLARAQEIERFSGLNLINCNLNTFVTTVRLIGSAVTIFHNFSSMGH